MMRLTEAMSQVGSYRFGRAGSTKKYLLIRSESDPNQYKVYGPTMSIQDYNADDWYIAQMYEPPKAVEAVEELGLRQCGSVYAGLEAEGQSRLDL